MNRDVFATNLSELGCTELHPHRIETGQAPPVKQRFYRATSAGKTEISRQVNEMLDHGIIEPSHNEWQSPVVLVKKKNNEFHFAVDYQKLNELTEKKVFPLPRMEDIFDTLGEVKAKYYSVADMFHGY